MGLIADILLNRTRWTYNGTALPSWETVKWGAGTIATNDEANQQIVITVDPTAAGYVPSTRTISASLPLRIAGGASADLSANRTISCNSASGAAAGSMSAAHYTLVNGATASPTASTLCLRGTTGEVCGAWFAPALTNIAAAGVVRCIAGDQTVIAIKGVTHATVPLLAVSGTGTKLLIGDSLELTDVEVDFYGGTFKVVDVPAGVTRIEVDAGGAEAITFRPGPDGIPTQIKDLGIALAGTEFGAEISGSAGFALAVCPTASTSPTVPVLTWVAPSSALTIGGHTAATTDVVVLDSISNTSIECGGVKAFEVVVGNRLNIFGAPVTSQGTRVGQLTDNTGGTVSTTLAAVTAGAAYSQTDLVALKNAVASLTAKCNALEARISQAAGGFAITA